MRVRPPARLVPGYSGAASVYHARSASLAMTTRGIVTDADIRMFREEGYCVCPHFFSQ